MARSKDVRRLELTQFREDDPVLAELGTEATARGVTVQQHIYDLLRARYLARRGQALAELLWIPTPAAVVEEAPSPSATAATVAAAAWLDLQE
jgi:hypothetical protein